MVPLQQSTDTEPSEPLAAEHRRIRPTSTITTTHHYRPKGATTRPSSTTAAARHRSTVVRPPSTQYPWQLAAAVHLIANAIFLFFPRKENNTRRRYVYSITLIHYTLSHTIIIIYLYVNNNKHIHTVYSSPIIYCVPLSLLHVFLFVIVCFFFFYVPGYRRSR